MSVEDNKAVARRFVDAVNTRRYEVLNEILTDDFCIPPGGPGITRDALKGVLAYYVAAFGDLKYDIVELLGEGERLAVHVCMTGTHRGDYQGHPGTGKSFAVDEVDLMQFRDGRIAGYQTVWDEASFRLQLGIS